MPIQVPELKRFNSQDDASVGRIETHIPDPVHAMEVEAHATNKLAGDGVDYFAKVERDAADTEATKRDNMLQEAHRSLMEGTADGSVVGIKNSTDDPTKLYNDRDAIMKEQLRALRDDPQLSGVTRDVVAERLNSRMDQLDLVALTERGHQQVKYDSAISQAAVKLEKENLPEATTFIQQGDPSSYVPFDNTINKIRTNIINHALKYGGAFEDPNGKSVLVNPDGSQKKITLTDPTSVQIKKEISDGIFDAIDNLVDAKQIEKAKLLQDRYKDYLDIDNQKKLTTKFEKADVKFEAYKALEVFGTKKFDEYPPEVKDKALQIKNDHESVIEQMSQRADKARYNKVANILIQQQMSGQPITTMTDLEENTAVNKVFGDIKDAKLKTAIVQSIVQPKVSSEDAKVKITKLLRGEDPDNPDVTKLSAEDSLQYLSGLNASDRAYYRKKLDDFTNPSMAVQYQQHKAATKALENQLISVGYIKRDDFNRISGKNELKQIAAEREFTDAIEKRGPMTPKELQDQAQQYAVDKMKGQVFTPVEKPKFQGGVKPKTEPDQPKEAAKTLIKGKTRLQWSLDFKNDNKGKWPNLDTTELDDYIKAHTK